MIVFLTTNPWRSGGGSEHLWQQTALWLKRQGYDVAACIPKAWTLQGDLRELKKRGVVFHPNKGIDEKANSAAMAWIRLLKPSLIVLNQWAVLDGFWWMGKLASEGFPYITMTNNVGPVQWPADCDAEQLARGMEKSLRNYFSCADNSRRLAGQTGLPIPGLHYFQKGFRVPFCPEPTWPESHGNLNMAMVGRLDPQAKGHDLAFHILTREKWKKRPVTLNVYGRGPAENSLRRLASTLGLTNVHFHDEAGDVEGIWKKNHYLLLPSRWGGLSTALCEAMLCGRGAVATNIGGNADLIENGTSGFVAAYANEESFAEAMEKCWERREEAKTIGRAARANAENHLRRNPVEDFGNELLGLLSGDGRSSSKEKA